MKISARNVFRGRVSRITHGPVSAEIEVAVSGGNTIISAITQTSAEALGLAVGMSVVALIKASNVMVMTDAEGMRLSARNCLAGKVKSLVLGPVSAEVVLSLPGDGAVCASITREAASELGLAVGSAATAVIKASAVIIGVEA